jgi:hypothetical protein
VFTINKRLVKTLCGSVLWGLVFASSAFSGVQDIQFAIRSMGNGIELEVQGVHRQQVFEQLFAHSGIKLQWRDLALANEPISGTFRGTLASVTRQLLAQTDFVIFYGRRDRKVRITRLLVIGRSASDQGSPGLAAVEAAMQSTGKSQRPILKTELISEAPVSLGTISDASRPARPILGGSAKPLSAPVLASSTITFARPTSTTQQSAAPVFEATALKVPVGTLSSPGK